MAIQSAGYILGAALAAVIYPVAGITAMIALDVLGALFASRAVLAAQIDAGGLDEAIGRKPANDARERRERVQSSGISRRLREIPCSRSST